MGSDFLDLTAIGVVLFELAKGTVLLSIWVLVPFLIGYRLPFLASGRKALNVMWGLAALALLPLAWVVTASGGPFGFASLALPLILALAYGLALGCLIRELSLRWNLSKEASRALAIRGFLTVPAIAAVLTAQLLWVSREPNAACLAAIQTVDVAGTRYRLPNAPFVVMPGENTTKVGWVINQRLRNRCARTENQESMAERFTIDLIYWGEQYAATKKVCGNREGNPRWIFDVCAAQRQRVLSKMRETFAATHLPLELAISEIPRTTERPYTLVEEHRSNLRRQAKRPYRELPGTASFSVYADGEQPRYSETQFWIRRDTAEPEAFACRRFGNSVGLQTLRCMVRYARGATMIRYEFETELGREEDAVAQVDARVHEVLAELTAPP